MARQMTREITIDDIWEGFVALMDNPKSAEEDFHQYMVRYPALVPIWLPQNNVVYSKFRLGSQYIADFAFCRDDTPGFRWHFIEIERPKDRLFNKTGNPTARLVHALKQLHDWDAWFQENRDYVARYFPHADRVGRFGLAEPAMTLIIGRRQEINAWDRPLMRRVGGQVSVRTFDSLRDNLRTAWLANHNEPLRCCTLNGTNEIELSFMKMEIRYQIG
jgi:hypothetical protein